MRLRTMKTRVFLKWLQSHGIQVRQGKGGEVVLSSLVHLTKMAINGRQREQGPETLLKATRKFLLPDP